MKYRAKIYDDKDLVSYEDYDQLCDAVYYCNTNAESGNNCAVTEVYHTLTGYFEYGTITSWDFSKDYA